MLQNHIFLYLLYEVPTLYFNYQYSSVHSENNSLSQFPDISEAISIDVN